MQQQPRELLSRGEFDQLVKFDLITLLHNEERNTGETCPVCWRDPNPECYTSKWKVISKFRTQALLFQWQIHLPVPPIRSLLFSDQTLETFANCFLRFLITVSASLTPPSGRFRIFPLCVFLNCGLAEISVPSRVLPDHLRSLKRLRKGGNQVHLNEGDFTERRNQGIIFLLFPLTATEAVVPSSDVNADRASVFNPEIPQHPPPPRPSSPPCDLETSSCNSRFPGGGVGGEGGGASSVHPPHTATSFKDSAEQMWWEI